MGKRKWVPVYRPERFEYLSALINEYESAQSDGIKEEVTSNLANFAYNPVNHCHLKQLGVHNLFLDLILSENICFNRIGIMGMTNFSPDPDISKFVQQNLSSFTHLLNAIDNDIITSVLTLLFFIGKDLLNNDIRETLQNLKSKNITEQIRNLIEIVCCEGNISSILESNEKR